MTERISVLGQRRIAGVTTLLVAQLTLLTPVQSDVQHRQGSCKEGLVRVG